MKTLLYLVFMITIASCTIDDSSGCPTTAACGCSNKSKADCELDYCCKWTVGQGCGCR